jgi:hypothetical protein
METELGHAACETRLCGARLQFYRKVAVLPGVPMPHIHPGRLGAALATTATAEVKKTAAREIFTSAADIVMLEQGVQETVQPLEALQKPVDLARAANTETRDATCRATRQNSLNICSSSKASSSSVIFFLKIFFCIIGEMERSIDEDFGVSGLDCSHI